MSHEPQGLASGRLALAGVILAAGTLLVLILCFFLWRSHVSRSPAVATYPAQPRLQPRPARDLATFRREQKNEDIWGWVDRQHGVARIPVERAMQLMARETPR